VIGVYGSRECQPALITRPNPLQRCWPGRRTRRARTAGTHVNGCAGPAASQTEHLPSARRLQPSSCTDGAPPTRERGFFYSGSHQFCGFGSGGVRQKKKAGASPSARRWPVTPCAAPAPPPTCGMRCSSRPPYRRSSRFFWVPSGLGSRFSWCLAPGARPAAAPLRAPRMAAQTESNFCDTRKMVE